jgi:hypothetical protein
MGRERKNRPRAFFVEQAEHFIARGSQPSGKKPQRPGQLQAYHGKRPWVMEHG